MVQEWLQRDEEIYSVFALWDGADKDRQVRISLICTFISLCLL